MTERFDQQTAVVTGAASGIGRAIVQRFVAEGGRVAAGDIDAVGLEALQSELGAASRPSAATSPRRPTSRRSSPRASTASGPSTRRSTSPGHRAPR